MDCAIIAMTNQVELTKGLSLNNNEQQRHCLAEDVSNGNSDRAHKSLRIQSNKGFKHC